MTVPEIAIETKCAECSKNSHENKPSECTYTHCEIHSDRLGKPSDKIEAYCLWCMADSSSEVARCSSTDCPVHPLRNA